MLFAGTELAARIERAESQMLIDAADAIARCGRDVIVRPIAGGVATYTGPNSPLNKLAGLGFGGPVDESALQKIEALWAERKTVVQAEVSCLADSQVGTLLTRRGYELRGFEHVLGLSLVPGDARAALDKESDIVVTTSGDHELALWIDTVVTGFLTPDTQGAAAHESFARDVMEQVIGDMADTRGMVRFLARQGGTVIGGASMRMFDGVAQLSGAATLPAYRRRGAQTAMLRTRLAEAVRAGCDLATVITLPGSKSHENAQRRGFELLYTRAVLVREGKGGG